MFKNNLIIPLASLLIFIFVGSFFGLNLTRKGSSQKPLIQVKKDKPVVTVGKTKIYVNIADSPSEWELGLSGRKSLPKDEGLLFKFSQKDIQPSFWMKNMNFPIDIIWINDDKVTQLHLSASIPEKGIQDSELVLYRPLTPIDYVLEVNSGFVKKNGISVGNSVDLSQIL